MNWLSTMVLLPDGTYGPPPETPLTPEDEIRLKRSNELAEIVWQDEIRRMNALNPNRIMD